MFNLTFRLQTSENLDPKRILLKGKCGTGASTLLKKLAYDWATEVTSEPNDQLPEKRLFCFEFLIPVNLNDVQKGMTISQIIAYKNPFITEDDASHLCDYLETNPSSVVFLIDGYDDYDLETSEEITAMISNKEHMKWCVVLATRPWKVSSIENLEYIDTELEILGFTRSGTEEFMIKYFQGEYNGKTIMEDIKKMATKQKLWDMLSYPILTMFMCVLGKTNKTLPSTFTDLYFDILTFLILTQTGTGIDAMNTKNEAVFAKKKDALMKFGKIAFFGNITKKRSFNLENTKEEIGEEAWKLGLLGGTEQEGEDEMAEFPCQSIQDFLAAYYFCNDEYEDVIWNMLKQKCNGLKAVYDLEYMLEFICGMSPQKGNIILKHIDSLVKESKYIKSDLSKPGPAKMSIIQAKHYEYINRLSEFLVSCSVQYKQRDMDFPVTALSMDLTPESANLISCLLSNENSLNELELLCLCRPDNQDYNVSTQMPKINLTECLRASSKQFHTLCLFNTDCSKEVNDMALELASKDNLKTLCLVNANLQPPDIKGMSDSFGLTCPGLEYLNLSGNKIQESVEDIANLLEYCPELKGISLSATGLSDKHVETLATSIKQNCQDIKYFNLSQNAIGSEFKSVCTILPHLQHLKHLRARECNIPSSCFQDLADAVENCPSLKMLDLSWNPLDDDIYSVLSNSCMNFKCLKTLYMLAVPVSTDTLQSTEKIFKCNLPEIKLHITQRLRARNMSGSGISDKNQEFKLRRANSQMDLQDLVPEAEMESEEMADTNVIKRSMSVYPEGSIDR